MWAVPSHYLTPCKSCLSQLKVPMQRFKPCNLSVVTRSFTSGNGSQFQLRDMLLGQKTFPFPRRQSSIYWTNLTLYKRSVVNPSSLYTVRYYQSRIKTENQEAKYDYVTCSKEVDQPQSNHTPQANLSNARKSSKSEMDHAWIQPGGHATGIMLYNSLTRRKDELVLPHGKIANW